MAIVLDYRGRPTKYCAACGRRHRVIEFYRDPSSPDGYRYMCMKAMRARQKVRDDRRKLQGRT